MNNPTYTPNPIPPHASHGGTTLPPIGGLFRVTSPPSALPAMPPHALFPPLSTTSNADDNNTGGRQQQPSGPSPPAHLMGPTPAQMQTQTDGSVEKREEMAAPPSATGVGARPAKPPPPPLDTMRAYRACLNCRGRKSKCDLDLNQGRPPCRRCQREGRDCILGESHRGGRRVRKKPKLDDGNAPPSTALLEGSFQQSPENSSQYSSQVGQSPAQAQNFQPKYEGQQDFGGQGYTWRHPTPTTTTGSTSEVGSNPKATEHSSIASPSTGSPYSHRNSSIASNPKLGVRTGLHDNIAIADLQNPSDALEILAQVADRADDVDSGGEQTLAHAQHKITNPRSPIVRQGPIKQIREDVFHYRPFQDGLVTPEMIYRLFSTYEECFHPFFPIAPKETFNRLRLTWLSQTEPHLFSAILTVASKDNEQIHQVCYDHMQNLVSLLLAGSDADIEAVEALLLLSQWVSNRPQASATVGRGEEDRVAWMYIGTALRLGYFLGIDRSSFKPDSREDPTLYRRKRLTWTACYMCDRQISVRVGKGFWSRGPGPLSGLKGSDFPNLTAASPEGDNWGLIFQANLELIQIFSNVHDILYSSKGHGWKEMLEGRYAKYLDDFRASIRNWNDVWGTFDCSPRLKASLLLTYDYLRLYVNAFAYQATISRALIFQRDSNTSGRRQSMPLINATATDARFIYEALDAAKSLLSAFNKHVDAETLRYMPSCYYLFVIYSAVFLYKARSTTTMTEEERTGVRRMILQTIERLQKASGGASQMGSRYARLLQLLWRKAPKPHGAANHNSSRHPASISERLAGQQAQNQNLAASSSSPISSYPHQPPTQSKSYEGHYPTMDFQPRMNVSPTINQAIPPPHNGTSTFSWLDLGATWNFATQNNSVSNAGSGIEMDMEEEPILWDNGMSPFDMGLLTDYSVLEGDNPTLIF